MSEQSLDTLANVAITLAAFSGVVVAFRVGGAHTWSPTELRVLWFLICEYFLVVFLTLLPLPLALFNWSPDEVWGLCSALLGSWFIIGNLLAVWGEGGDHRAPRAGDVRAGLDNIAGVCGGGVSVLHRPPVAAKKESMMPSEVADGRNANTTDGLQTQGLRRLRLHHQPLGRHIVRA